MDGLRSSFCLLLLGFLHQSEVISQLWRNYLLKLVLDWLISDGWYNKQCLDYAVALHNFFLLGQTNVFKSKMLLAFGVCRWELKNSGSRLFTWRTCLLWYMKEREAGGSVHTYLRFFYHRLIHGTQTAHGPHLDHIKGSHPGQSDCKLKGPVYSKWHSTCSVAHIAHLGIDDF